MTTLNLPHNSLPTHPTLHHPLTGQPLRALGERRDGRLIWPVIGGAPDDPTSPVGPTPIEPTAPSAPPAVPSAPSAAPPVAADAPVSPTPPASPRSLEDLLAPLDDTARAAVLGEVTKARQEAGAARTSAKQKAADDARTELAQTIGKALGLVKDDEPVDPAKLTEQLTTAQSQVRQTQVELAVYQAAATTGANPVALLDSRSFLTKIAALEPNDSAGIQAAITEAVTSNPGFAATTAPGGTATAATVPKPNPAQGSSGSGAPSLDDQIAAAKKDGNMRLALHLTNQQLLPQGR